MKLSKDQDTLRASALIKRDRRHDKSEPPAAKVRSGKNRRRWCRGKQGVEHVAGRQKAKYGDHIETVCINCGMAGNKLPEHVRAAVDAELAERLRLAEQWCGEGHLYDTVTISYTTVGGYTYEHVRNVCVMCGKRG